MDIFLRFCLTLAVALAGGFLGKRMKLPAGLLVGSMIAVAAFHIVTDRGVFYPAVRVVLQVLSGALVGSRMGMAELKGMRSIFRAVAVLVLSMLLLNISFALLIMLVSDLDAPTALFATSPGGASDMGIIAADFGGDAGIVAILQVCRLIMIYLFIPPAIRRANGHRAQAHTPAHAPADRSVSASVPTDPKKLLPMLLAAAAGGAILHALGISAGAMIGAMIGSAAFCILRGRQKFPARAKDILQICSGAYIGCRIDQSTVAQLDQLVLPLAIMLAGIFFFTFAGSAVLRRVSSLDRRTAMLAATPGGIQEMSLLSEELGADTPKVAVLHTARIVFVILFFPQMIQLLLHILG